jgi:class 3 adenylate cyclase/tetratricopeptide (TPR) repeat protein
LFTDIEGSTGLWERHPSLMAATLQRHDEVVGDALRAEGGEVFKTVGDAIHAVFASPVAALRAALAAHAVAFVTNWGEVGPLSIRIGVYTGEANFVEGEWRGRPLNRCARLRDAAAGGEILASHATIELVGEDLEHLAVITDLGVKQLRGVPRGERVHLVQPRTVPVAPAGESRSGVAARNPVGSLPAPLLRASRRTLIGRGVELERMTDRLSETERSANIVLVSGEAGVGKTRLVAAVASEAATNGDLVLFGRCDEGLRAPYQPFVEALGTYSDATPADVLATQLGSTGNELRRLLPGLADRVIRLREPTAAAPETERWLLFDATAHFVEAIAAERQLVLVLDDLQWAEPATLLLLRHLARADLGGLIIVATARPSGHAEPDAFAETLADLAREHRLETITLGGLSADEVTALVADRLDRPGDQVFARALHTQTEGNPFFVHELVSHLSELGLLAIGEGGWPTQEQLEQVGAPAGLRQVLMRRIGQLSEATRGVLLVAGVAGDEFAAADLAAAMGADLDDVIPALEEAASSGLVAETFGRPGVSRFAHALIRHTLYESASALRRARLHWRVAEAIRASTDPRGRLSELAYHYRRGLEAGDPLVAVDWLHEAGDQAVRQVAFEEAIEHYRGALAALDLCPDDPERRYDLLAGLGESAAAVSDFEVSHRAWLAAVDIARFANDPDRFFRAAYGYDYLLRLAPDDTFDRLIAEGLELAGAGDSPARVQLLARGGAELWLHGVVRSREEREASVREALAMARRLKDPAPQQWALGSLGHVLHGSSRANEQLAIHSERLQLMEAIGLDQEMVWPYRDLALAALQLGRRGDCEAALQRSEMRARAGNRRIELHNALQISAAIAVAEGRFDDARQLAAASRDVGGVYNIVVALDYGAQLSALRAEQGQTEKVIQVLNGVADDLSDGTLAWRTMLAGLYADLGLFDEAALELEALAAGRFAAIPRAWSFPLAIRYVAETCAQLGDAEIAKDILPEVEPYSGQMLIASQGTSIEAAADRSLAQLYGVLGRVEDAERHYEAACSLEESMGFVPLAARTRYWHARLLAQSGNGNDRQRALSLLRAAQANASALGMARLHQQVGELHRLLEGRDRASAHEAPPTRPV